MITRTPVLILCLFGSAWLGNDACLAGEYAKISPFRAIRWESEQPIVKIDGTWCSLESIDGIKASNVIAFSKETYGVSWQMRFEEDLVEVLAGMKHQTGANVDLVVSPLDSDDRKVLNNVAMTRENREHIRDGRFEREKRESATHPAVSIDDAENFQKAVDEFLESARATTGLKGAFIVARKGEPVCQGSIGVADLKSNVPNSIDTPFRIASLSKQFTAAAIFRLEAAGELRIDDLVSRHLPEFEKQPYSEITIHHLLTHSSGFPKSPGNIFSAFRWHRMSEAPTPAGDYVDLAIDVPLEFKPGDKYQYSNIGYRVLSALIERVTEQSFADFMEQEIFQPLGMKNSGVARVSRPESESRIAQGMSLQGIDDGIPIYVPGERGRNFGTGYGSGGIYSSASDLLIWDRALAGDKFLSAEHKKRLFEPIHGDYACGWVVRRFPVDDRLYQFHNGGNPGFFSMMMRLPDKELVIIAVGNVRASDEMDEAIEQFFRLGRSIPYTQ